MSENRPADQDELELTDAMAELSSILRQFAAIPEGMEGAGPINVRGHQGCLWPTHDEASLVPQPTAFREQGTQARGGHGMGYLVPGRRRRPSRNLTIDKWITVLEEEVPKLEEQGSKVYCPPFPALDPEKGNQDKRPPAPPPADVIATDNPVADGNHYLRDGFEMMKRMSENKWKPGDLLDEDGSDPKVKDRLASYASPSDWDQITDLRSATSTSHLFHHDRPDDVCVGWGGYDEFNHWQSCGRRVTKDMVGVENPKAAEDPEAKERVEERKWEDDNNGATEFVNEAGEVVFTVPAYVTQPFQRDDRQTTGKVKPRSLYSRLHPHKTDKTAKKPKEPKEPKEPVKDWWW
ncbi:hypothetical protein V2G26_020975 [Clonostachys chloroleuca]